MIHAEIDECVREERMGVWNEKNGKGSGEVG